MSGEHKPLPSQAVDHMSEVAADHLPPQLQPPPTVIHVELGLHNWVFDLETGAAELSFIGLAGSDVGIATVFQSGGLLAMPAVSVRTESQEAFLDGFALSGAGSIDLSTLTLESLNSYFVSPDDTVVVLTSEGHYYALGDFQLSILGLSFDYVQIG